MATLVKKGSLSAVLEPPFGPTCGPRISGNAFLRATKAELEDCNARPYRYDSRRFD